MVPTKTAILDVLQELLESEIKEFRWHLWNGVTPDIKPIPRGKLENAEAHDIVDYMVQQYGASDAGKIAVRALRSIKQNELANELKKKLQEVSPVSEEASVYTAGAAHAAGVAVKIKSSNGGSVTAPVMHGGVFNGPVTFN